MTLRKLVSRGAVSRGALVPAVVLLLLLAACGAGSTTSYGGSSRGSGEVSSGVDVNTPALRKAKQQAGVAQCPSTGAKTHPVTGGLPRIVLPCLGGGPSVALGRLRGPLVVNLWAQWCGPCREELPFYQRLHHQAGDRLRVIGIDYQDTQPMQALGLVRQTGVTYPLLADPGAVLRVPLRVRGLPGVLLIDRKGRVTDLEYTVIRSYPQLTTLVRRHLGISL